MRTDLRSCVLLAAASLFFGCGLSTEGSLDELDPGTTAGAGGVAGAGGAPLPAGAGPGGSAGAAAGEPGTPGGASPEGGSGGLSGGSGQAGAGQAGAGGDGGAAGAAGDGGATSGASGGGAAGSSGAGTSGAGASGAGASGAGGKSGAGGMSGAAGAGGVMCMTGLGDCNGDASDGCEADLTSLATCGSCQTKCPQPPGADAQCSVPQGCSWQCQVDRGDCDKKPDNGCEESLPKNPQHCGKCGHACVNPHGAATCQDSKCVVECATGFALCGGNPDQGCTFDLQSDAANCGECGHSCRGSLCQQGLCMPTTLSSGNPVPYQVIVDSTHLYWVNLGTLASVNGNSYFTKGQLRRVDTQTTMQVDTLATDQPWALGLAQRDSAVYLLNVGTPANQLKDGEVWSYDKTSLKGVRLRPNVQIGLGLAASADGLFYDERDLHNVFRNKLDGNSETKVLQNEAGVTSLAAVGGQLYWVCNADPGNAIGRVRRGALTGAKSIGINGENTADLATNQFNPDHLWADDTAVYYINQGKDPDYVGQVQRIDQATGKVTTVADQVHHPVFVTSDATHVYWTECGTAAIPGGRVMRQDKATHETRQVASDGCPAGVAVDGTWVYFSSLTSSDVRRIAR